MDEDYKSRVETNIRFIQTLRNEVDEQKLLYEDRRKQNADLNTQLDKHRTMVADRTHEIQCTKNDLLMQHETNQALLIQKGQLDEEMVALRERNREDLQEIERMTMQNDQKASEGSELANHIRSLEFDISKTLNNIEEMNRMIDQKQYDVKSKEGELAEAETEIHNLKNQMNSFMAELQHLKNLETRYKEENNDLQLRIDQEGVTNVELSGSIKELEVRIRQREDQLMYLRKELEGARYSNQALHENNATMQNEIDSMNNHIRVVSGQNDQLTREIDAFVQANEMIRAKLDRRGRVEEIKHRNVHELNYSHNEVVKSRSPVRPEARPIENYTYTTHLRQ